MYDCSPQLNDMDDVDETSDDLNKDDDYTDEDEIDDTQGPIGTRKNDFTGMEIYSEIESHMKHSYFKVPLNDYTKFVHRQNACWLLTDKKVNFHMINCFERNRLIKESDKCFFLYAVFCVIILSNKTQFVQFKLSE